MRISAALNDSLQRQRAAFERDPYPSSAVRKDRLTRAIAALLKYEGRILEAVAADFGGRSDTTTLLTDVLVPVRAMRYALRNLDRWMRPERRKADFPFGLLGSRAYVFYQPLGVVGIVSPWNVPLGLAYQPLAAALAAGNRAMIKPSEMTPRTSELMAEMTRHAFAAEEVEVCEGGVEIGSSFVALPFDHLLFTGSTRTARAVLRAAAENLTPVTLELGGKAPVIVARGSDMPYAASKVLGIKLTNGGQICMGPDYVLVHRSDRDAFVSASKETFLRFFPDYATSPDVTCVFLPAQRQRLAALVQDAVERGAQVVVANGLPVPAIANEPRFPLVLVIDPPRDAAVMRQEIFGPVLPVLTYEHLDEAIAQVRSFPRPLAVYHFGGTAAEREQVLKGTHAGGTSIDDVMLHPLMHDLPFGGVGESGMGRHVGQHGFRALSNAKAVAHRPWVDLTRHFQPPYSPVMTRLMRLALRI